MAKRAGRRARRFRRAARLGQFEMLKQLGMAWKIMAPVWGQTLVLVLMIAMTSWFQGNVAQANRNASAASARVIEASEVRGLSRAIQRDALKLTIEAWNDRSKDLQSSINTRSQQLLARAGKLADMVGQDDVDFSHDFVALQETVVKEIGVVMTAALSSDVASARDDFIKRVEPAEKAASKKTDAFIDAGEAKAQALAAEADRIQASSQWTMLLVGIAAVVLGLGGSSMVAYAGIIFPLRRVMASMARVSAGDHESRIDGLERRDEIGDVAKAVSVIRDAAMERARLESEAADQRAAVARERERAEAERCQNEAEQSAVVDVLANSLTEIAKGDLTERIDAEFKGRFQQIKTDFNAAIAKLENAMEGVVVRASAITSGSQEISTASDDLSHRTEQQAASLEETAAALEEITATVKKTAEGASHARAVVAEARGDAEKSGQIVRQAVDAMGKIEKSSQGIGQIIGVIDEIAFQTNLLALNAGVEAARAGDAGRGFAVVASEVRALAQRSAEAAKEIKTLIAASSGEVGNGVKLVAETGESLARIVAKVSEINSVVGEIAASAQEQATSLQQVNIAVNQMDQTTQKNAAMAEEATAASRSLSQETGRLSGLVGQFQICQAGETNAAGGEPRKVVARAVKRALRASA
jgi:methyl-accepting chemotaxis protein